MATPPYRIHSNFPAYAIYPGGQISRLHNGRNLSPVEKAYGYQQVTLVHRDGKRRCTYVARLVAEVYHPNPEQLPDVSYRDGNPRNVAASNLYWSTGATTQRERPKAQQRNRSGLVGATYLSTRNQWQSYIVRQGKRQYLGTFKTAEEAHHAYLEAKNKVGKA